MTSETKPTFTPLQLTLSEALREIEMHVAQGGWDGPVRVFALVKTALALEATPEIATELPEVVTALAANPEHLISVEQEDLPPAGDLEELLGSLSWPESVHGAAIVVERFILPPAAEEEMPEDPEDAVAYLEGHPDRQEVRIAVGALRDGPSWCAVRSRANDSAESVGLGPDLVPGLIEALRATFE